MANNVVRIGGERQVNFLDPIPTSPNPNGLLGSQNQAQVTALPNGNFVVVYTNNARGLGDLDIMAVEFNAAGSVVPGSTFRVDFDAGNQITPDVAPRLGGGYVAVWDDNGMPPDAFDNVNALRLVVVAPGTGSDPETEFTVEDNGFDNVLHDPAIATFANGTYIVSYTAHSGSGAFDNVRVAIVNAAGNGFVAGGAPKTASYPSLEDSGHSAVATSGNTAAIVFDTDHTVNDSDRVGSADIYLTFVTSSGVVASPKVVSNLADNLANPDVAALKDGRFVVVWENTTKDDVFGRIYNPVTKAFSGGTFVVSNRAGDQGSAHVAGLPDGGFMVTWTDFSHTFGDASASGVHARRFDANGTPLGDEFLVNTATNGEQNANAVAANAVGTVFTVWVDRNGTNGFSTDTSSRPAAGPVPEADDGNGQRHLRR